MSGAHPVPRVGRMLCTARLVGMVVVWVIFLRPQFLGARRGT